MSGAFPALTLEGSPRVRGVAYGRAAINQVRDGIDFYQAAFANAGLDRARRRRLADAAAADIAAFDAGMLEELEGIAEGARVELNDVVALNARSELLKISDEGCTGVACMPLATQHGHTLLAQNWDWHPSRAKAGVLLRIFPDDGPAMLTFTEAGTLARCGLNEHGLGVVGNALACASGTKSGGVPVGLIRRRILTCKTVGEAVAMVRQTRRGTATNHLIASIRDKPTACECTPDEVYELGPEDGLLCHGNHFGAPDARAAVIDTGIARTPDTLVRVDRIRDLLSRRRPIDGADVQEVLRDHDNYPVSLCRHAEAVELDTWTTVASVVMDLDARRMWLAVGPPCEHAFDEHVLAEPAERAA